MYLASAIMKSERNISDALNVNQHASNKPNQQFRVNITDIQTICSMQNRLKPDELDFKKMNKEQTL